MGIQQEKFENLVEMFIKSTERYKNNPLFGVKQNGRYEWMTYAEVAEQVKHLRGGLSTIGVGKDDVVAIIANNSPKWAISAYATYSLGAQFVPMYEVQLVKDWKYIINDCGAKVLIVANEDIAEKTRPLIDEIEHLEYVICMEGSAEGSFSELVEKDSVRGNFNALIEAGKSHPADPYYPAPSDVCGFIYTSGTTGKPKGVLLTHENITSNVNAVHAVFPMTEGDTSLSFLPWAHSFGQTTELHCLLSYGAAIGLVESVATILVNLGEIRPTILFSVPRIFNRIYDSVHKKMAAAGGIKEKLFHQTIKVAHARKLLAAQGKKKLHLEVQFGFLDKIVASKVRESFGGRLRYAFSGGAALSKVVGEFIDDLGIQVYEGYGLTETSPITSVNFPDHCKIGSVGLPIPGVRVEIVDFEDAREGEGEIVVYGPNIMKGYHNLPAENEKVFTDDGGFRTGDMGRLDSDGYLYITGRVKEQYKLENGKYVVPSPLEEQLKLSTYLVNVMIDGCNRPFNIALIVPDMPGLEDFAKAKGISYSSLEDLLTKSEITALIQREIDRLSVDFKGYEKPRKFALSPEEFSTENGLLTPSLKTKRRIVMERYKDQIDALYVK